MPAQHTYSTTLGIIGNIASMALFLSPTPTFWKILKTKEVGSFTPSPYVLTVLNCCFWIIYGLPQVQNLTLVISINAAGLVIEFIYVSIFMIYAKGVTKRNCLIMICACSIIFIIITCVALLKVEQENRATMIGSVCVIFGILQSFAPLTVMATVIRTKSVEFLPVLLSAWIFMNGSIWTAYGCWPADVFIIIPNGASVLFGLAQITLWCIYRKPRKGQGRLLCHTASSEEHSYDRPTTTRIRSSEARTRSNPIG